MAIPAEFTPICEVRSESVYLTLGLAIAHLYIYINDLGSDSMSLVYFTSVRLGTPAAVFEIIFRNAILNALWKVSSSLANSSTCKVKHSHANFYKYDSSLIKHYYLPLL